MRRLSRESWRQSLAMLPALPMLAVPVDVLVRLMLLWNVFAAVYLTLTLVAFRGMSSEQLLRTARANLPSRWERLVMGGPEHLAQAAAICGFVIAALALPQADDLGPTALVVGAGVVAVLGSWFTLHMGFAMHYLSMYVESAGLDFPGDEKPVFSDFTYLAYSVGTTCGSGDVTVTGRGFRRAVQAHGLMSFFFNTMVLALTIAILTTFTGLL
ncbi:DUF1345 domain-containing protein [Stackebrandtia endophytica]|nr:DUF1345 domain-containing protein [Stackebrandtia endophytica]